MGWRRRAGGGKRDTAERPIIDAMEAVGAFVRQVGGTGNPDLIVRYQGRWVPMEVKTGKGKRTKNQQDIEWPIVTTPDEALREIGATR
jgi:hypothetical protein